jgi:hypothetical protein
MRSAPRSKGPRRVTGTLAVNTTLTQLNLAYNELEEEAGRAIGQAYFSLAAAVNRVLTNLDLEDKRDIGAKGARQIGQVLQVNRALTCFRVIGTMHFLGRFKGLSP